MSVQLQKIVLHILVWIQFLILPLIFFPKPFHLSSGNEGFHFFLGYVFTNIFLISIFYFNYQFAIPKYYFKNHYYAYGAIIFVIFVVSIVLSLSFKIVAPTHLLMERNPNVIGSMIIRLVIVLVASFGLKIYERWRQTELEKSNVELSYLKAQINPHFLFNTLNGIYALAVRKSDEAPNAIVKLSSIMRYVINDAKEDFVSLEKEMKYVSDYIDLQKMRLNKNVNIIYKQEGLTAGKQIVPMLYISFVENAFKYGVSTEETSEIEIEQIIFRNELSVFVKNKKFKHSAVMTEETGIGIKNSQQRLEQMYPGKYRLELDQEGECFTVKLKIELK